MASYTNNPALQLRDSPDAGPAKHIFSFLLLKPFKVFCFALFLFLFRWTSCMGGGAGYAP